MKTNLLKHLMVLISLLVIEQQAMAISFGLIKRGFRSCTANCQKPSICELEQDVMYRWCVDNCSYKFDIKGMCDKIYPNDLRPILPVELSYGGSYNTNQVSITALNRLDRSFIEQTPDRRRAVGTAKLVMLVKEQVVKGVNVQLTAPQREKMAERLFLDYFKSAPKILEQYKTTGTIPDDELSIALRDTASQILTKIQQGTKTGS